MSRGGSKLVTGIISFFLGFLFAILVEIGAIFGVYWFVMNKDINTVMAAIGIHNTDDRYVNTDPDKGGVTNLKELLSGIKGLVYENGEITALGKSFDDFKNLIPATQMLLNTFYGIADDYIELDKDAFESKPLTELAQVLSDSIMNIKTAALLEKLGMTDITGEEANPIVKSLVTGAETDYATVYYSDGRESDGLKFPVIYDCYMGGENSFDRIDYKGFARPVNGVSAFPENLRGHEDLLCPQGMIEDDGGSYQRYMLFYVPCRVTASGIAEAEYSVGEHTVADGDKTYKFQIVEYGADTDFIAVKPDAEGNYIIDYTAVYAALNGDSNSVSDRFTGYSYYEPYASNYYFTEKNSTTERYELKTLSGKNYFRNSQGKMLQLDALTLTDIVVDAFGPLDAVLVTEAVGENSDLAYKVFGTTSLGALLRGEVDFNKLVEDMEVSAFVNNISPDNSVMCYIAFKVSDLNHLGGGLYSAVYDKGGEGERTVTVRTADGFITDVLDADGSVMEGVKIKDVAALANSMPVTAIMDVRADEAILAYLGYGVKNMKPAAVAEYSYTAKINIGGADKECYIATAMKGDGENAVEIITSVWYLEGGNKINVSGTRVNDVADRANGFTKDLTLGDVLNLDGSENNLLKALSGTALDGLAERVDTLTVGEIFSEDEINSSTMLRQLRGKKVSDLATAIDELLIQSIYAEEVYGLPEGGGLMEVIAFDPSRTYYTLEKAGEANEYAFVQVTGEINYSKDGAEIYYTRGEDGEWKVVFNERLLYYTQSEGVAELVLKDDSLTGSDRDNATGKLTEADFEEGKYYSYGAAKGMWRLVLYRQNTEKAYTINNFNNMVNSCADNVYKATLYELQEADIIEKTVDLSKKFGGKELGTFTLETLIDAVILLSE